MAPRGDLLSARALWVSGWPNAKGEPGPAGGARLSTGASMRAEQGRGADTAHRRGVGAAQRTYRNRQRPGAEENRRLIPCAKLPSKFDYGLTTLCPSASRYTRLATSYGSAVRPHTAPLVAVSAHPAHERQARRSDARHHAMRRHVLHGVTCGICLCEGIPSDTRLTEGITPHLRLLWRSRLAVYNAAISSMMEPS
jgi:hypothetical protein